MARPWHFSYIKMIYDYAEKPATVVPRFLLFIKMAKDVLKIAGILYIAGNEPSQGVTHCVLWRNKRKVIAFLLELFLCVNRHSKTNYWWKLFFHNKTPVYFNEQNFAKSIDITRILLYDVSKPICTWLKQPYTKGSCIWYIDIISLCDFVVNLCIVQRLFFYTI